MWVKASILGAAGAALLCGCGMAGMGPPSQARDKAESVSAGAAGEGLVAAFNEAMGLIDELRFDEALARLGELEPLVAGTADVELASKCLFWHGFCQEKLSRPAQAALSYRRVLELYPQSRVAEVARRRLAALEVGDPLSPS